VRELKQALFSSKLSDITGLEVYAFEDTPSPTLIGYIGDRAVVAAQRATWEEAEKWFLRFNLARVRDLKMEEQKGRCARCGCIRPLQLHHIVYRSERRDDRPGNLELLDDACHRADHGPTSLQRPTSSAESYSELPLPPAA
jgi:hypothetical protein